MWETDVEENKLLPQNVETYVRTFKKQPPAKNILHKFTSVVARYILFAFK